MLRARPRSMLLALGLAALAVGAVVVHADGSSASDVLSGRIVVAHQDGKTAMDSRLVPLLETAQGPVALRLPDGLPAAPGASIAIHHPTFRGGAIVGGRPVLARLGPPSVHSQDPTLGLANFTPGAKKVLVLLVQVAGQPAPGSADAIRNVMFTAPNSVNQFIQEETYGQVSLTGKLRSDGDVFGPYVVQNSPSGGCNDVNWGTQAEAQFKAATGYNAETWDNVVVVFQFPFATCAFTGQGEIGQLPDNPLGPARHAWVNAVLSNGVPTVSVVAHELGHNFGVDHAGGLVCSNSTGPISFSEVCAANPDPQPDGATDTQYLDPFDVMGNGIHEENGYHRWESGWMPSSSVQTVTRSGTYLLAPLEAASSAVQLYEVPRIAGAPSYWLDFRQPFGTYFDDFSPFDPAVNGVTIRYANSSTMPHPSKSWLIDTNPETSTFADAPLGVGRTFSDEYVSITTLSVSPLGALVHITVPNGTDTTPPGPVSGLSVKQTVGGLQLSWNAASDDSGTVQHYVVTRNSAPLADVYATTALDPAPIAGRTSTYVVTPLDPAGNAGAPSTIQVSVSDTTPPSAPTDLAASITGAGVRLSWTPSTDDVAVASYEVDRDGQPLITGLQTNVYVDQAPAGSHVYTVRATDTAGNIGAFAGPITVVVVGPASIPAPTVKVRLKVLQLLELRRVGKHEALLKWKAQKGVHRYEILRAATSAKKKPVLLATVKRTSYTDTRAPVGALQKKRYVVRAIVPS